MLSGKIAIITGASSGIGAATARLSAKNGATVVVSDIDKEGGDKIVTEIKDAGGTAVFKKTDIGKPKDNEALVKFVV